MQSRKTGTHEGKVQGRQPTSTERQQKLELDVEDFGLEALGV